MDSMNTMSLTYDKVKKIQEKVASRSPIFYCTGLADEIYCGVGIDKVLENKLSFFNSKIHEGFLVPLRLQIIIEGLFPDSTYS